MPQVENFWLRPSNETISRKTGLTAWQVARGMTELRDKGLIVPVTRTTTEGYRRLDGSNTGHVARYCLTPEVWEAIKLEENSPQVS